MSQELTAYDNQALSQPVVSQSDIELVKKTVAKDATNDELRLYLHDCKRIGVHPLDGKLHFTKRGGRYVRIVGIDLLRQRAHETGCCVGISDPEFEGFPHDDIEESDFMATVTVKKLVQGMIAEFPATARYSEYCPPDGQNHMWKKMPHTMLGKCAEALALRKGFPELGGFYTSEEMDQASIPTTQSNEAAPAMQSSTSKVELKPDQWMKGTIKSYIPHDGKKPYAFTFDCEGTEIKLTTFDRPKGWDDDTIKVVIKNKDAVSFKFFKNQRGYLNLQGLLLYDGTKKPEQYKQEQQPEQEPEDHEIEGHYDEAGNLY